MHVFFYILYIFIHKILVFFEFLPMKNKFIDVFIKIIINMMLQKQKKTAK